MTTPAPLHRLATDAALILFARVAIGGMHVYQTAHAAYTKHSATAADRKLDRAERQAERRARSRWTAALNRFDDAVCEAVNRLPGSPE